MSTNPSTVLTSIQCPLDASDVCTIDTCSLDCAHVHYLPSVAGNAIYLGIFAVLLFTHLGLGIKWKTWGFVFGMILFCILEIVGFAGRIFLHDDPFSFPYFVMYLVCLTVGPVFLTASIYICLSRVIIVYGTHISRFSPRVTSITFMCFDVIALILQAAGGAIAASAQDDADRADLGTNIMIAGLVWQVFCLCVFILVWADFTLRLRKTPEERRNARLQHVRFGKKRFFYFQIALWLATVFVIIRSIYRAVELWAGFDSELANNETLFMILEGVMLILAALLLTIWHPGMAFSGEWGNASWSLRGSKSTDKESSRS